MILWLLHDLSSCWFLTIINNKNLKISENINILHFVILTLKIPQTWLFSKIVQTLAYMEG